MSDPKPIHEGLAGAVEDLRARARRRQPVDLVEEADDDHRRHQMTEAWRSAVPRRYWDADVSSVEPAVTGDLAAWVAEDIPPNLVILGPVGTGKTWAAIAAVRPAFFARRSMQFSPVGEFLDRLRPGGDDTAMYRFCHSDQLVIDDIGSERGTEWTAERMFAVVNRRWLECRPTITTSNLSPEDLAAAVGERTFSRLVGNDALVLTLRGADRRRS